MDGPVPGRRHHVVAAIVQTKTDALDARLIARLLYEREFHSQDKALMRSGSWFGTEFV